MPTTRIFFRAALLLMVVLGCCRGAQGGADPVVLRKIDALLGRMSEAAKKGDKGAFLSCLDLANPFFYAEQAHWCDDLAANGVEHVAFSREAGSEQTSAGEATLTLGIVYTSRKGAATEGTKAKWPARFIERGGSWLYAGEDWKTLAGDGFSVRFLPGDEGTAAQVIEAFPKARAHVDAGFGITTGPQQIVLFQSMPHLKATVYLNQPDQVLMGWNEPGESIKFMHNYTSSVEGWTAAFAHEYGHVATWEYGAGIKDAPWWVSEGVAELAAEDLAHSRGRVDREIRGRAKQGTLVPWADIADYDTAAPAVKLMAYHQGHHMLGYISEQWGREGRTRWLRAMGRGKSIDQACEEVMGMNLADLNRAWRGTLPSPSPSAEMMDGAREGVEATIAAMEAAAKAGDFDGWLATIYRGDREFLQEQTYFANDLRKKPAHEVSIELGEFTLRDDVLDGPLTFTWTMGEKKKEREVKLAARFIRTEGADGASRWLYAGETWHRRVAPGAVVNFDEGLEEAADEALAAFAEIRPHVEIGFNLTDQDLPHKTQKIKLYGSMKHLQESICLSYENSLGGWNEPGESIKLLVGRGSKSGGLRNVIAHEYGHVATFELGPKSNLMPWWILEGVADLAAEKYGGRRAGFIENAAKRGSIAPWEELADFETVKPKYQSFVYRQGHHMLGYISDRWGRDTRVAWLTAMAQGASLDEASRDVLGLAGFEELNKQWRATLPAKEEKEEEPVQTEKTENAEQGEPAKSTSGKE